MPNRSPNTIRNGHWPFADLRMNSNKRSHLPRIERISSQRRQPPPRTGCCPNSSKGMPSFRRQTFHRGWTWEDRTFQLHHKWAPSTQFHSHSSPHRNGLCIRERARGTLPAATSRTSSNSAARRMTWGRRTGDVAARSSLPHKSAGLAGAQTNGIATHPIAAIARSTVGWPQADKTKGRSGWGRVCGHGRIKWCTRDVGCGRLRVESRRQVGCGARGVRCVQDVWVRRI